ALEQNRMYKDGAIVTADAGFNEVARLSFFKALLTEIDFPALDASSKDAAKMTIKLQPETTRIQKATGSSTSVRQSTSAPQKKWLAAKFRLNIDGLDDAC